MLTIYGRKVETLIWNTIIGVQNLFKWFPTIWRDRDFDYAYAIDILKFKIENMKDLMVEEGEKEETISKMAEIIEALDRIANDQYLEKVLAPHYEKYGEPKIEIVRLPGAPSRALKITYDGNQQEAEKDYRNTLDKMTPDDFQQHDIDLVFSLIANEIQKWWI